jgi:tol-pal system protein YbgF
MIELRVPVRTRTLAISLVALTLSGCLATRSDVQILQQDLRLVRSEAVRDDSLRGVQIERLSATLRSVSDSLGALSLGLSRLRADVQGRFTTLEQQIVRAQELAGLSQSRVQELRAQLEQARPPATEGPPAAPGPNQLYQLGRDQYMRGSHTAARAAFEELLTNYPDADVASDAQFFVAEAFGAEGNPTAADSVYAIVVTRYPTSARAATALYKRGVIAQNARRTSDAQRLFNEVISRFPRSDEAALARDRLRAPR